MIPIHDTPSIKRFPIATVFLVAACFYVFYLQLQHWNSDFLLTDYALTPSNVTLANPASLLPFVTAIFLHGSIMHIVVNMLFLWVFGNNVENHIGSIAYLLLYIIGGVIGNAAQYFLHPESNIPIVGASGAIAAILGAYFVFFPRNKVLTVIPILIFPLFVSLPARLLLLLWFFLQIFSTFGSPTVSAEGGVAYAAHVGGFVVGLLYAAVYTNTDRTHT